MDADIEWPFCEYLARDLAMDRTPERFSVIVGRNGCGKSRLLAKLGSKYRGVSPGSGVIHDDLLMARRRERARFDRVAAHMGDLLGVRGLSVCDRPGPGGIRRAVVCCETTAGTYPVDGMGRGALALVRLLLTLVPDPPSLLLLDDFGSEYHPTLVVRVVELLNRVVDEDDGVHVVAATHVADVLDLVRPEQILFMERDEPARVTRMVDARGYDRWSSVMTPSEFWGEYERARDHG